VARIRIDIAKGVSCEDLFFLVDNLLKILLRILFISKIKMAIIYKDDGL
jgi:hypothetical protein